MSGPARAGVLQLRKNCRQIRKMFIPTIMTAQLQARMAVTRRLTWAPITSRRQVSSTSGTKANGMPKDSTTWLSTSASVGFIPAAMMISAGIIVSPRRTMSGMRRLTKPAITTWPA